VLGLKKGCSEKDIKQAYRHLALELHPDKLGANATEEDTQRFMEVRWGVWTLNNARYAVLLLG
jgi:DnaJ-class molecular chaperone